MTAGGRPRLLVALAVALSAGFALAAHALLVSGEPSTLGAALCLIPFAVVVFAALRRTRSAAVTALAVAAVLLLLWAGWTQIRTHFPGIFFLEHVTLNLFLAWIFGRSLAKGRDPLVRRFARIAHGGVLPPGIEDYTRKATLAWMVFFLGIAGVASVLYQADLRAAWSLFVNIGNPVLLVAMFAGEYAVRHRALPHVERLGILAGVEAFSRHFRATQAGAPR